MTPRTHNQLEKIAANIETWMDKMGLYGVWVETSGGMGSFETFYVEFQKTEDHEPCTIRVSDHANGGGRTSPDFYLWFSHYSGIRELKAAIKGIVDAWNETI